MSNYISYDQLFRVNNMFDSFRSSTDKTIILKNETLKITGENSPYVSHRFFNVEYSGHGIEKLAILENAKMVLYVSTHEPKIEQVETIFKSWQIPGYKIRMLFYNVPYADYLPKWIFESEQLWIVWKTNYEQNQTAKLSYKDILLHIEYPAILNSRWSIPLPNGVEEVYEGMAFGGFICKGISQHPMTDQPTPTIWLATYTGIYELDRSHQIKDVYIICKDREQKLIIEKNDEVKTYEWLPDEKRLKVFSDWDGWEYKEKIEQNAKYFAPNITELSMLFEDMDYIYKLLKLDDCDLMFIHKEYKHKSNE